MDSYTQANQDLITYECAIPEPGQLVEVRRRQWVVSDVQGSAFTSGTNNEQHIVTLSSLDEDAMGEELQVLWQIEPGARVLEKAGLPKITGWDSSDRQEAFLDAVRWGAVTNADRSFLQAPFRSGITIEDYQLDPLVRAIDMARVNLLITDDVGLGKTIEAGLVIQELLVRHRARSVFIVCPATLLIKWKTEMWDKFGLEFRIVDTAYIKQLRREHGIHANPWTSFPRLISSMDWMKSGEGLRRMKDILPPHITYPRKFDILVVDEAHNVSPAAASLYALESKRTRLIRSISPHFEHRIFLSATPHNGYKESFTSLLELLDDQRFARSVMPDEKQLQRVMVRRLKSDIVDADGKPVFPKRNVMALEIDYTDEEREIHKLLGDFTELRMKSVQGTRYRRGLDFIHKLLKKRLFSSPMAFANTFVKHLQSLEKRRTRTNEDTMNDRILRKAIMRAEEEFQDDAVAEEALHEAVEAATELSNPLDEAQRDLIVKLTAWADMAKNRVDSKATAILDWLESYLKTDGDWNGKRVILFTEYRATLVWIQQILAPHGYGGDSLMILHGSIVPEERERIKAAFQTHPDISPVRILLATDAASEGIDLQNHCNYIIHIEIPWNPNVMEQRNGRVDRHGQKESDVFIWHPVGKGYRTESDVKNIGVGQMEGDHEYLMRAVQKINTIREDLGSVGPVIANQIEEAMLGRRNNLDTKDAETKAASARRFIVTERKLKEKIVRLHEKLMEAKEDFRLAPVHIARTVLVALEIAGKPALKPVSFADAPEGSVFEVPVLSGSWGRSTAGLEHPHTGVRRPITFDHEVARGRDDVVLAHLNHRFVQMCLRLLREELWKLDDIKNLHRVSVRAVSDNGLDNPVVVVWSRLVVIGGDHHRLHEEITLSGGELKSSGFARIPQIGRLASLVENSEPFDPDSRLSDTLKERYQSQEKPLRSTVEARSTDRMKYLDNTLNKRKESEKKDIIRILDELEKKIHAELKADRLPTQLMLPGFEEAERDQVRRDLNALKMRLARIPEEKDLETDAIDKRFARQNARTFPVAVVLIVPRSFSMEKRI